MKLSDLYGADAEVLWFECVDYITDSETVTDWRIKTRKRGVDGPNRSP